jgi:16S rRNA (guanine966-N2)-methyltransferase
MRIIAGEFRGRRLLAPEGQSTRPVTDRVKQSLFDILAPLPPGSLVYDCFAGTGSMGLECLSRGAAHATFFEVDRHATARLCRNIADLRVGDRSTVVTLDLFRHFSAATGRQDIDLIFLDPPYRFVRERAHELRQLGSRFRSHLRPDGLVVFRHDSADVLALPGLAIQDTRTYGHMTLEFLRSD